MVSRHAKAYNPIRANKNKKIKKRKSRRGIFLRVSGGLLPHLTLPTTALVQSDSIFYCFIQSQNLDKKQRFFINYFADTQLVFGFLSTSVKVKKIICKIKNYKEKRKSVPLMLLYTE